MSTDPSTDIETLADDMQLGPNIGEFVLSAEEVATLNDKYDNELAQMDKVIDEKLDKLGRPSIGVLD